MTVGRNDPCPCGSGRKYKKCCLPNDEAARAIDRSATIVRESALRKLLGFTDSPEFNEAHELAFDLFWSDALDDLDDEQAAEFLGSDDVQAKYHAWLLFDFEFEDGGTFADRFLQRDGRVLDPRERAYVDRMRQSFLSLYQVKDVDAGRGLLLRDLLTKEEIFVTERSASEEAVRWDLLGARLVPDENGTVLLEGGLYLYGVADRSELLRAIQRARRKIWKTDPDCDRATTMKRCAIVFNDLWLDFVVFRPMPVLQTPEGDPILFTRSIFDIADAEALRAVFAARDDLNASEEDFVWLEESGERKVLGAWRFDGSRLLLETISRVRADLGREWIEEVAPGLTTFRATQLESPQHALRARPPSTESDSEELPPEFADIQRQLMDQHYRAWLDEPIPALEGATPREAAASRKLRPLLVDLLQEFENASGRARLRDSDAYDTSWLWEELGIER